MYLFYFDTKMPHIKSKTNNDDWYGTLLFTFGFIMMSVYHVYTYELFNFDTFLYGLFGGCIIHTCPIIVLLVPAYVYYAYFLQ